MNRVCLVLTLVLALAGAATAQENKPDQQPSGGNPPAAQKPGAGQRRGPRARKPATGTMTKPVAELQKLNFLLGVWKGETKIEPSDFAPQGGTAAGRMEVHPGPGNLFLIANIQSRSQVMGQLRGHMVTWWDPKEQVYRGHWCDNMNGCENSFFTGKWEGDKLVFTGTTEYQGKKIAMRDTFSDIKPDSVHWSEETSTEGGPMKLSMSTDYARASAPPPAQKPNPKM